jgi:hypothetical protein
MTKKEKKNGSSNSGISHPFEISNIKRADDLNYAAAGQAKLRKMFRDKIKTGEQSTTVKTKSDRKKSPVPDKSMFSSEL